MGFLKEKSKNIDITEYDICRYIYIYNKVYKKSNVATILTGSRTGRRHGVAVIVNPLKWIPSILQYLCPFSKGLLKTHLWSVYKFKTKNKNKKNCFPVKIIPKTQLRQSRWACSSEGLKPLRTVPNKFLYLSLFIHYF